MIQFLQTLKRLGFRGETSEEAKVLDVYSRDASLFEVIPQLVVYPRDAVDIGILVKAANAAHAMGENVSLTARAAGTDMSGGPLTESVVVDMTRHLNRVIEVGEGYAITEPGVFYRDFEKATLAKGWLLPSYPASRELCALGGMLANNSGGEKTLTYGKTIDYVEELKVVLRDGHLYTLGKISLSELENKKKLPSVEGEIYRALHQLILDHFDLIKSAKPKVSKNSAGYYLWDIYDAENKTFNLAKLFVGSQGTLGLIVEAKLRLIKPKSASRLLTIMLPKIDAVAEVANRVLKFKPESFESYDDHTLKIAVSVFPQLAKRLGGNIFSILFNFLPEFWAVLTGGMPKMILLAEFTADTAEAASRQAKLAEAALHDLHLRTKVTKTAKETEKFWLIRRESFNLLRQHVHGKRTAPFIDDIIVQPNKLPEFLPKLYALLDEYKLTYTIAGHVGDGNFHIIPLMNVYDPDAARVIRELGRKVYELTVQFGGSITGEHNDGLIRTPYLELMFGEKVCALFAETKKIFDPDNIFNPGKKVNGNLEFALAHLVLSQKPKT